MTYDTAIGSAITGLVAAGISYAGYRASEKNKTRLVEVNRDRQTAKLEDRINELARSIPPPMVFDASSITVTQLKTLSKFIAQENEAHMNGRYHLKIDANRRFDGLERMIEQLRRDVRDMLKRSALALSHHDPEVADELARDLRKTNPPD